MMARRDSVAARGVCRCEATVAPSILEGFACGNPDCWRTAPAQASFDGFVAELVARRGQASEAETTPEPNG